MLLLGVGLATFFAWPELQEAAPAVAEAVLEAPLAEEAPAEEPAQEEEAVAAVEEPEVLVSAPPVASRPAPPPAPVFTPAPSMPAPDSSQPTIAGTWVGNLNGIPKVVQIQSSGGEIISLWRSDTGGDPAPTLSAGKFDPSTGRLTLQEQDGVEQQGRYEFVLDEKTGELKGKRFAGATGRNVFTVILRREGPQ